MLKNIENIPNIRFKGFEDNWQKKRLGDIGKFYRGHTYSLDNVVSDGLLVLRSNNIKDSALVFDKDSLQFVNNECSPHILLRAKDLVVCMANGSRHLVGKTGIYNDEFDGKLTVGAFCSIFRSDNNFSRFLFLSERYRRYIHEMLAGTNIGNLKNSDLEEFTFWIPASYLEQAKIAEFFTTLDERIQTQQSIVENLEKLKKGYMQKIFSQELRFKDENGEDFPEWEVKKIGEILVERKQYSEKEQEYPHVTLAKNGIYDKGERYNRDFLVTSDDKLYKITKLNDICYNPANLKFGVICRNDYGKAIFSPIYVTLEVKNANPIFVGMYLQWSETLNKIRRYEEGTVYERQGVKPEDFINVKLSFPFSMKEQELISTFLSTIELKIKTENQKLEKLNLLKSGYLQQMFI